MSKVKKIAVWGMIAALSLGLTACGNGKKADSTATPSATSSPTATSSPEASPATSSVADDAVLAKVGDVEILGKEFNDFYNSMVMNAYAQYGSSLQSEEGAKYLKEMESNCLDTLVAQEALYQQAEKENKVATDAQIEETVKSDRSNYKTDDEFNKAVKDTFGTEEDYKNQIKRSLTINAYLDELQAAVNVTDDQIKEYYDKNKDSFKVSAGANMKHILVRVDSEKEASDKDYAKECEDKAKAIKAEADKGTDFDKLMEKYQQQDPNKEVYVAEDLGYVTYDQPNYDPLFLEGTKNLKEGEVSNPVKSSFGWHVIQTTGLKDEHISSLDEVKDQIKSTLESQGLQDKINEVVSKAKVEKHTELLEQ